MKCLLTNSVSFSCSADDVLYWDGIISDKCATIYTLEHRGTNDALALTVHRDTTGALRLWYTENVTQLWGISVAMLTLHQCHSIWVRQYPRWCWTYGIMCSLGNDVTANNWWCQLIQGVTLTSPSMTKARLSANQTECHVSRMFMHRKQLVCYMLHCLCC